MQLLLIVGALVLTIRDAHKFANPYVCLVFKLLLIVAVYLSLEDVQLRILLFFTHVILMHLWNQQDNYFASLSILITVFILNIVYIVLIVANLYGVILYILYSVWCGALLLWTSQLGDKENVLPQQQPPRLVTSTPPKIKVLSSLADGLGGRKVSRNEIRLSIK